MAPLTSTKRIYPVAIRTAHRERRSRFGPLAFVGWACREGHVVHAVGKREVLIGNQFQIQEATFRSRDIGDLIGDACARQLEELCCLFAFRDVVDRMHAGPFTISRSNDRIWRFCKDHTAD